MKEITILSGKGGTGKTTITAALASVAKNAVYCDNDVDAADLHLIFKPKINEEYTFFSGWKANINTDKCTNCGLCTDYCRFKAIQVNLVGQLVINHFHCEGCRLCERICPEEAITSERNDKNQWFVSTSRLGMLVHAQMAAGEENSSKLVTQVRKRAKEIAKENGAGYIINDGPPGIGCATISSLTGTDMVLIVTEPTKSGLHDTERLLDLIESFKIKAYVVINKYDLNREIATTMQNYLDSRNVPLVAKIPFNPIMVESMLEGKTVIEYSSDPEITTNIHKIWNSIKN
ncbi:MAG: 4Fe-4S binding protein [Bacteroidales bacterium]|nr:4Fe-4S binding protein [Bacteroidales bacterium]